MSLWRYEKSDQKIFIPQTIVSSLRGADQCVNKYTHEVQRKYLHKQINDHVYHLKNKNIQNSHSPEASKNTATLLIMKT